MTTVVQRPRSLVGVSMPRSGHHYLEKLLRAAYGARLHYCEFYTAIGCCGTIPCQLTDSGVELIYQKNHDFDLAVPADLRGVTYVVQYREPVLAALSDREYYERIEDRVLAADRDHLMVWLGMRAAYYIRFLEKWVVAPPPGTLVVPYSDLLAVPAAVLEAIADRAGASLNAEAISGAIAEASGRVADFPAPEVSTPFVARTLERSRFFDSEYFQALEQVVLGGRERLAHLRCLAPAAEARHPVAVIAEAELAGAAGHWSRAVSLLREVTTMAPANAFAWERLAQAAARAGDDDTAINAAREALDLRTDLPSSVRLLSDLHARRANHELHRAAEMAERLVRLRPQDPGHTIHLASLRLRQGHAAAAHALTIDALTLAPQEAALWREGSEILSQSEDTEAALAAVDQAILRASGTAEFHHHRANLLARLRRVDEAAAAHERATTLEPGNPDWMWKYAQDLVLAGRRDEGLAVLRRGLERFPDAPLLNQLAVRVSKKD